MNKRLIAINLPQFHPFKENDEWWGKGFTEWTNVAKARPRFKGHYQLCYYHYWFNGKQLMERPVSEILSSGKPDYPFMLCWANENWTRAWDGGEKEILIEQHYSEDDDAIHMNFLCTKVFSDPRYIRINNRPFFIIYRPDLFPDIKRTIKVWQDIAEKNDMRLYLGFMRADNTSRESLLESGFDAAIDFQPHFSYNSAKKWYLDKHIWSNLLRTKLLKRPNKEYPTIVNYKEYVDYEKRNFSQKTKEYPGITPAWDNSPRRSSNNYWAFVNSTPCIYGDWLRYILDHFVPFSTEENFIFVNAWNEWAEGNHLEPDQRWGVAYLEETQKQLKK